MSLAGWFRFDFLTNGHGGFRANGGVSQSMLEQARESERESIRTASMFEPVLGVSPTGELRSRRKCERPLA